MASGKVTKAISAGDTVQTIGGTHFRCVRRNNVVQLSCAVGYFWADSSDGYILKWNGSGSGTTTEITIVEELRPFGNIEVVDANQKKRITVNTNGKLSTNETLTAAPLRFTGVWLAADSL